MGAMVWFVTMAEQQKVAIDKKGNFLEDPSISTESMRLTYTPSDIDSPPSGRKSGPIIGAGVNDESPNADATPLHFYVLLSPKHCYDEGEMSVLDQASIL